MIEAIARQYITGSMWRAYKDGEREFCGITLPEGLKKDQKLPDPHHPSTKGVLTGLDGVPEADDVNVSRADIERHYRGFNFSKPVDIDRYEVLLKEGFSVISDALAELDQIFVDTKFEFGYVNDAAGNEKLIYMDEVGTPTAPASGMAPPCATARSSRSRKRVSVSGCSTTSRIRTSCSTSTACPSASPWPATTSCRPR